MKYVKYPRTFHLPWSESNSSDDVWHDNTELFDNQEVVVMVKMDGENSNLYNDHIHARSLNSGNHPSRTWLKNLHAKIKHEIPEGYRICGENLFAFHSIFYTDLPSYFMVFNIWDRDTCLSWEDTKEFCELLELITVPVIYEGIWNEKLIKDLWEEKKNSYQTFTDQTKTIRTESEGYVVRLAKSFKLENFHLSLAKFVRANHVQTSQNWMTQAVVPNELISSAAMLK